MNNVYAFSFSMALKLVYASGLLVLAFPGLLTGASLWNRPTTQTEGMFARTTANAIGDLVTVQISESTELTTNGVPVQASAQSGGAKTELLRVIDALQPGFLNVGGGDSSEVRLNLSQLLSGQYSGSTGTVTNAMEVTQTQLTARVIDTLPNGTLLIEGRKSVIIGGETIHMLLRGLLRPLDIDATNTVSSARLADALVEFQGEGTLSETQRKGWLTRLLDGINPF